MGTALRRIRSIFQSLRRNRRFTPSQRTSGQTSVGLLHRRELVTFELGAGLSNFGTEGQISACFGVHDPRELANREIRLGGCNFRGVWLDRNGVGILDCHACSGVGRRSGQARGPPRRRNAWVATQLPALRVVRIALVGAINNDLVTELGIAKIGLECR